MLCICAKFFDSYSMAMTHFLLCFLKLTVADQHGCYDEKISSLKMSFKISSLNHNTDM